MFEKNFNPVLRFLVVSDVHYEDERTVERERMEKALETAYRLAEGQDYNKLDAVYVVGDFANSGSPAQMKAFKDTIDNYIKPETVWNVSLASHEFGFDGEEGAVKRLKDIFELEPNTHRVINGFHFISVGCTRGCHFDEPQRAFALSALKRARKDSPKKPIFFFQHPHISGTVYGSVNWGEDELNDILCNFPQIIDFSGHSHAPINDPRSIHQRHFTCLGTGTLSYFENDEFDKYYTTLVPGKEKAAQMLIVESDAQNRVRVYPYDLITDNFFPFVWRIDEPSNPQSFIYTDERYKSTIAPYFDENAVVEVQKLTENSVRVKFPQAKIKKEYVNDYNIYVKDELGNIVANKNIWSEYYFYNMPEFLTVDFEELEKGNYHIEIFANSFWAVKSKKSIISKKFSV